MLNEAYEKMDQLEKENKTLKIKLSNLEKENMIQKDTMRSMEENISSNVDILKRLSNLEKVVFKDKES